MRAVLHVIVPPIPHRAPARYFLLWVSLAEQGVQLQLAWAGPMLQVSPCMPREGSVSELSTVPSHRVHQVQYAAAQRVATGAGQDQSSIAPCCPLQHGRALLGREEPGCTGLQLPSPFLLLPFLAHFHPLHFHFHMSHVLSSCFAHKSRPHPHEANTREYKAPLQLHEPGRGQPVSAALPGPGPPQLCAGFGAGR